MSPVKKCDAGHRFFRSGSCPVCPLCEGEIQLENAFLALLVRPARSALVKEGILKLEQLACYSEKEILKLHGIGPASLPAMRAELAKIGLSFKK